MIMRKIEHNLAKERKRVAAYCRVSTDKDDQEDSLENQMDAFRYRVAVHPEWELIGVYADEGLTGTTVKNRVQFQQMIKDCEDGKIDYVITKSISRFARNTLDCIGYVRKLQAMGVQVYFEKEGIDTAESTSEMLLTIMASFAQEESRSISENVKWGMRKRFRDGREVRTPLYGYYHTKEAVYQVNPEEAEIVREIFERFVHGDLPQEIMRDMIERGEKPPAGDCWKRLQIDRMIRNEKYIGDATLQKTYVENHLTHKQVKNKGQLPIYSLKDVHQAIIDRHTFEQAQKITKMRRISAGNNIYPYGTMLKCPYCGKPLVHGSLNNFSYNGANIQNGGWGCYGEDCCGKYLLIQKVLDDAMIEAYEEKYGERKERVDFYWLDDTVEKLELERDKVTIHWRDGTESEVELKFSKKSYTPKKYAEFYNGFLKRIDKGERKNKYKNLMGLDKGFKATQSSRKRIRS